MTPAIDTKPIYLFQDGSRAQRELLIHTALLVAHAMLIKFRYVS